MKSPHRFARPLLAALSLAAFPPLQPSMAEVRLPPGFAREVVAGSELEEPIDMTFAPDGALWVSCRRGQIWRVEPAGGQRHLVGTLNVDASGDRGLHGIALHPDFPKVPQVFLFHHRAEHSPGTYHSQVVRWDVEGVGAASRLSARPGRVLVEWEGDEAGQHTGGALFAHPVERALYVTSGDNNKIADLRRYCNDPENQAQSVGDLRGKVLRIGFDGAIPRDNPFAGRPGARGEVYTLGHRQPWGLSWDRRTGLLLLAENGGDELDDFEEVNRLLPGKNYGWPRVFGDGLETLTRANHVAGFTAPWFTYPRNTGGSCTAAVLYRGPETGAKGGFPAQYEGGLFYADYNRKSVRFAPVPPASGRPEGSQPFLQGMVAGPVGMRVGPEGALYLVEYGGWFCATTNDAITRIVWRP